MFLTWYISSTSHQQIWILSAYWWDVYSVNTTCQCLVKVKLKTYFAVRWCTHDLKPHCGKSLPRLCYGTSLFDSCWTYLLYVQILLKSRWDVLFLCEALAVSPTLSGLSITGMFAGVLRSTTLLCEYCSITGWKSQKINTIVMHHINGFHILMIVLIVPILTSTNLGGEA